MPNIMEEGGNFQEQATLIIQMGDIERLVEQTGGQPGNQPAMLFIKVIFAPHLEGRRPDLITSQLMLAKLNFARHINQKPIFKTNIRNTDFFDALLPGNKMQNDRRWQDYIRPIGTKFEFMH